MNFYQTENQSLICFSVPSSRILQDQAIKKRDLAEGEERESESERERESESEREREREREEVPLGC